MYYGGGPKFDVGSLAANIPKTVRLYKQSEAKSRIYLAIIITIIIIINIIMCTGITLLYTRTNESY